MLLILPDFFLYQNIFRIHSLPTQENRTMALNFFLCVWFVPFKCFKKGKKAEGLFDCGNVTICNTRLQIALTFRAFTALNIQFFSFFLSFYQS